MVENTGLINWSWNLVQLRVLGHIVLTSTFNYNFLVLIYVSEIFKKTII